MLLDGTVDAVVLGTGTGGTLAGTTLSTTLSLPSSHMWSCSLVSLHKFVNKINTKKGCF